MNEKNFQKSWIVLFVWVTSKAALSLTWPASGVEVGVVLGAPGVPWGCGGGHGEQGHCGVGRGLSELHWVWCNGRGPHDKLRQEPQGSFPGFECAGSDSDRRVPAELGQDRCQETFAGNSPTSGEQ